MKNELFFLKPNVMMEPLVDGWYAWAHLIPPATTARNLTERHLRIMDSYIDSPETHESEVRSPALSGGPFMDFDRNRAQDVKKLRERTLTGVGHLITPARAIEQLNALLREMAVGYSFE